MKTHRVSGIISPLKQQQQQHENFLSVYSSPQDVHDSQHISPEVMKILEQIMQISFDYGCRNSRGDFSLASGCDWNQTGVWYLFQTGRN